MVSNARSNASLVPRVASAPNELPSWMKPKFEAMVEDEIERHTPPIAKQPDAISIPPARVDVPVPRRLMVPVARMLPATESFSVGVVVPIPTKLSLTGNADCVGPV